MTTERSLWAKKRNWLIRRLRGAKSIFCDYNLVFMMSLLDKEDVRLLLNTSNNIDKLIRKISDSKWND